MTTYMTFTSRALDLNAVLKQKSCFLFGPRQTGKTTLIQNTLQPVRTYNLLESDTYLRLSRSPELLRQQILVPGSLVVIDEIQKLPILLDEVHTLIESLKIRFLLTGSSARKMRRAGTNLLGGRARHRTLHPFVSKELPDLDLMRALRYGLLPSIYTSDAPAEDLRAYVGDYLKEEVANEGAVRNIPAFSRFLEVAALCSGQMINFTKIANDAQVARTTVHEYFEILKDTLLAHELRPWQKGRKRKAIATSKYYLFDNGVTRTLQGEAALNPKSPQFGLALESFIFHELQSYCDYTQENSLAYWRSTSGFEVDFVLNDDTAIEVKSTKSASRQALAGLKALAEERSIKTKILVCLEEHDRKVDGVLILPWRHFLERLWAHDWVRS